MKKRLLILSVLGSLLALAFVANNAMASHEKPVGANPMRISLVPAFQACDPSSANSTHGAPLNFQSCNPPAPVSTTVKAGPGSIGWAQIYDCAAADTGPLCNQSAPGFTSSMRPDVRVSGNGRDVQCRITGTPVGCTAGSDYNPNGPVGAPYTTLCAGVGPCNLASNKPTPFCAPGVGSATACIAATDITATATLAQASGSTIDPTTACSGVPPTQFASCVADKSKFLGHAIRVTDHYNCNPSAPGGDANACPASAATSNRAATMVDLQFPVPVDCISNPEAAIAGSNCGANTTANALVPGSVIAAKQAVVEVGEVQQLDSGPNGVRGDTDDQIFSTQGVYLP